MKDLFRWQSLITLGLSGLVSFVASYTFFTTQVSAQTTENINDIKDLQETVSNLPSQDWFVLKFENIDDRFNRLEQSLDNKVDK